MKEYGESMLTYRPDLGMSLDQAVKFVRDRRQCITPNAGFVEQLRTWDGLLLAGRNRYVIQTDETIGGISDIRLCSMPLKLRNLLHRCRESETGAYSRREDVDHQVARSENW